MAEGKEQVAGGDHRAVYVISVAAELAGVHPQTLRIYEQKGLLRPKRTEGNTRRYSDADVELLRSIQVLTQVEGINLAGVKRIMELKAQMQELRQRVARLEVQLTHRRAIAMPGRRTGEIVPARTIIRMPWHEEGTR